MAILTITVLVEEVLNRSRHNIDIINRNEVMQQMTDFRLGTQTTGYIDAKERLHKSATRVILK
jgi:hypothetical protein